MIQKGYMEETNSIGSKGRVEEANPAKIFIGNLSWGVREDDLTALFGQYGTIADVKVIMEKYNPNRSKGMAFLEFTDAEAAQAAIEALHDYELDGRKMIVAPAQPKGDRDDRDRGNNRGGFRPQRRDNNRGGYGGGSRRDNFGSW